MPERPSAAETAHPTSAEVAVMQAEVQAEMRTARADLAADCLEAHNHSPEARLCWLCAEAGLPLGEQDPAKLLAQDPYLQRAFGRPLPMRDRLRSGCLTRLAGLLGETEQIPERQPSARVAAQQAHLVEVQSEQHLIEEVIVDQQQRLATQSQRLQTHSGRLETETERRLAETENARSAMKQATASAKQAEAAKAQELASLRAVETLMAALPTGTIAHYRSAVAEHLSSEGFSGEALQARMDHANQILDRYAAQLNRVQAVFTPQEVQAVFGGPLTNTVSLNLGAISTAEVYADLFTRIDAGIADQDRRQQVWNEVSKALEIPETDPVMRTGTQLRQTALATVTDPETGEEAPIHTPENKAEVYPGVYTFTETGRDVQLELNIPGHHLNLDVTGMDGVTIGLLAEMMSWQAATEELGATSFVASVYKIDFEILGSGAFDPISMIAMRNRLTAMVGSFEGHDGDIFDPRTRAGLIRDQMRAASPTGTALGWENDHHGSVEHCKRLGLDRLIVLQEFSRYIQHARAFGGAVDPADVHVHLHRRFPDLVEAPEDHDSGLRQAA